MSTDELMHADVERFPDHQFGATIRFEALAIEQIVESCLEQAQGLTAELNKSGGLLILKGLAEIKHKPQQLVDVSQAFGFEVENCRQTLTSANFFHGTIDEILVLSARPPCGHLPPPPPVPGKTAAGSIPVQFPLRKEWHTDQSYRRPAPDISLLFAVETPPKGQGQTLYADCTAAYRALDKDTQCLIDKLNGIHAPSWIGRSEEAVTAGEIPKTLLPHQYPQKHPLVRVHPDTGHRSLFICEPKQMDFVEGPIEGLPSGPDSEGAKLLYELLSHATKPDFVYIHDWQPGDLLIADNRCLIHCPTWYDAEHYSRLMWRTTVSGNPGQPYLGEEKSWISKQGITPMHGMERP